MNIKDIDLMGDSEDVYRYFDQGKIFIWYDAAAEGKEILAQCVNFHVEENSPIDQVILGVAAASHDGALMLVAEMLGLDFDSLDEEILLHSEVDRDKPAISFDELVKRLAARTDDRFLPEDENKNAH